LLLRYSVYRGVLFARLTNRVGGFRLCCSARPRGTTSWKTSLPCSPPEFPWTRQIRKGGRVGFILAQTVQVQLLGLLLVFCSDFCAAAM
jgi:hypothetical protein